MLSDGKLVAHCCGCDHDRESGERGGEARARHSVRDVRVLVDVGYSAHGGVYGRAQRMRPQKGKRREEEKRVAVLSGR